MIKKLQRLLKRTAFIFAITIIILLVFGTQFDNQGLIQLLALSFVIAVVHTVMFQEVVFSYSIPRQIGFIGVVWLLVVGANFLFQWNHGWIDILLLLGIVLATYFVIRLIVFYQVKGEAEEMNRFLQRGKEK